MTLLRSILSQTTVRAVLASLVIGTASALAWTDRIDGPSFLGLAVIVAGFYFNKPQGSSDSK